MEYQSWRTLSFFAVPCAALLLAGPGCGGNGSSTSSGGTAGSGATSTTTNSSGGTAGAGGATGGGGMAGSGGTSSGGTSSGGTAGSGGTGGGPMALYDCTPPAGQAPKLKLTQIAKGFSRPVYVTQAPGDTGDRLFVVEQTGKIWITENGQPKADPFLDIQMLVSNCNSNQGYHQEQGLLGLAFHPKYAENGRFFVNYTDGPFSDPNPKGNSHVVEYKRSADSPDKADPNPVQEILEQDQPYTNHNGGNLQFGPDGFLYIGFGDGGSAGDPQGNGQNLNTWLAKMLRIDVDSGKPYAVPKGNLPGGKAEIWDYGLRNPWRYSFDLCTGDLYIGDVGQDNYEEVDVEKAGMGNKDYGWNTMEGLHCFNPKNNCKKDGLTLPVVEYDHLTGKSITGGYVYRGSKIPGLRGTYFYADYVVSKVWTFKWDGGASVTPTEITGDLNPPQALSSFGQDNYGEVYLTSLTGAIYRIDAQ